MVIKILLIISIVLQFIAAFAAIRLTRVTKYNFSWILFTIALSVMAFLRFGEYIQITQAKEWRLPPDFFVWLGIATSLCFAVGLLLVQKIFKYIASVEAQRRLSEKRILNAVIRTEESERQRFSKDLHDGLGPLLSSAKLSLSALGTTDQNEKSQKILSNANMVIDEAIRSLREVSNNLSPHILNNFGVSRAVSNFINRLVVMPDMKIKYTTNLAAERFDMDVEVILYRVICELINNSIRHSGATEIRVDLNYSNRVISVEYSDNGCGFDVSYARDKGMGFSNITSRISTLKGHFDVNSEKGKGMNANIKIEV